MTDTQYAVMIALLIVLCLASIFALAYSRRRKPTPLAIIQYPQIMEVAKLEDVPDSMRIMGNLVYVNAGFSCKGLYMHNGTDFVKVENKKCPTCGK